VQEVITMELTYKIKKPEAIKNFLHECNVPSKLIRDFKGKQLIMVNNEFKTYNDTVKKGDTLKVTIPDEEIDQTIAHENIPLDIVYEDEYLMIINKPYDMAVMVTKSHESGTLSNALCYYFDQKNIQSKIHLVNRLDKDTCGLLVVAKNRFIKFLLSDNLKAKIDREYYAIVDGILPTKSGTIDLPIGKPDESSMIRAVMENGDEAITEYKVIKDFIRFSLLKVVLETGRTHQIRVHMSHFNFPIVGDPLYNPKYKPGEKMLLCSYKVSFKHPITGLPINFELDLPENFKKFMKSYGA
jgi:23S rRNA pseudouridine1911/1915/1917 synthase